MAQHLNGGDFSLPDGDADLDGSAKALAGSGVGAIRPLSAVVKLAHREGCRLGLTIRSRLRKRLFPGQGVFHRLQNSPRGIGGPGNRVHLPALLSQNLSNDPFGPVEEGLIILIIHNIDPGNLAVLHNHLHMGNARVAGSGPIIGAVLISTCFLDKRLRLHGFFLRFLRFLWFRCCRFFRPDNGLKHRGTQLKANDRRQSHGQRRRQLHPSKPLFHLKHLNRFCLHSQNPDQKYSNPPVPP